MSDEGFCFRCNRWKKLDQMESSSERGFCRACKDGNKTRRVKKRIEDYDNKAFVDYIHEQDGRTTRRHPRDY